MDYTELVSEEIRDDMNYLLDKYGDSLRRDNLDEDDFYLVGRIYFNADWLARVSHQKL
jgi:hypothetical protein